MDKPDGEKTREELIAEIAELRKDQQPEGSAVDPVKVRAERRPLTTRIELIPDFDLLQAEGLNISKTGIAFEIDQPLWFEMRFKHEGALRHHRARLVWVKGHGGTAAQLGLELGDFEAPDDW